MSISTIAAQLYTIQAKKNIPLKTAFSMLVREDLAMRFSIYNLTKIITKSEFLASVAQTAFGERTPLQRKQDEEESIKEKSEKKFKQFTVQSIVNLNRNVALLKSVTMRNSELINNLYAEIGSYRGQRRIDPRLLSSTAIRVPVMNKTVKGKLDQINKEIEQLKKAPTKIAKKVKGTTRAGEKDKKKEKSDFITSFLPLLLRYPRLLMMLGGGAATAIGLGSFAAQAYSLYNLPGAFGRVAGRLGGQTAFEDPLTEQMSQVVDPAIVGVGAYTVGRMATAGAMALRKKPPMASSAEGRLALINKYTKEYRAQGYEYRTAQKMAGEKASLAPKHLNQVKKFGVVKGLLGGISKRVPAIAAADIAITISRMSGFVADHSSGTMSQQKFKNNMVSAYADLISTVGLGGAGTILGGLAGTALFPGLGTLGGAVFGGVSGYILSLIAEESAATQALATKLFEMIHEDKSYRARSQEEIIEPQNEPSAAQRGTGEVPPDLVAPKRGVTNALNDADFINEVYRVSDKYDLNPLDLLEIIYLETAGTFDPSIRNPTPGSTATGLIQFTEATAERLGTSTSALRMMTRSGQMKYVDKYFEMVNLPKGANRGQIYAHVFLPSMAQRGVTVFADKDDPNTKRYYELNRGLDVVEPFGKITIEDFNASTNRLVNIIPATTAQMIRESNPLINVTPNVTVKPPPENPQLPVNDQKTDEITDAQIASQAALQVSADGNQRITRLQEQVSNHDSRLNLQERNSRTNLARNTDFDKYLA
jgi:hypothetical protein